MDNPQEYEVESVTRARVHDKKGKKITWRYYVKWKGYGWDESTWEPTDSFQGGSEHILESFWERIDTGGRDISDASAFKRGEELLISGPPGKKGSKRKIKPAPSQMSPSKDVSSSHNETISAPPLATRKRRRVEVAVADERGHSKLKRRASTTNLKDGETSTKVIKRRRISSPRLRKRAQKRLPSAGDSQLDADGETDPDVVEVEDELMQVSAEDVEEDSARMRHLMKAGGKANGSRKIEFDDLEHFYSGHPIDIDQHADEQATVQKPESRSRLQSPPPSALPSPKDTASGSHAPTSPALSSSEPLFGSPPHPLDEAPAQRDREGNPDLPAHRARAANPLVKLIDMTTLETTDKQSRITAKARLMTIDKADIPPVGDSSHVVAKRGGKPGPGRSSSGLVIKNRGSLLTATKGTLKTVKGKFAGTTIDRDQPDEIEETPTTERSDGEKYIITSLSDKDTADQDHRSVANSQPDPPLSGDELPKSTGLQKTLPDQEDAPLAQLQDVEVQGLNIASTPVEESHKVEATEGSKSSNHVVDTSSEAVQRALTPAAEDPSVLAVVPPAVETIRMNIELAKEQLFPSTRTSFDAFDSTHSSFRSTIFGPLYQGYPMNNGSVTENELLTTFKVMLSDGVELPLVLKDCGEIKARIGDVLIGNFSGSKVAVFYSAEDALAMVSAMKGDGTARVVLDPSAGMTQQENFSMFLQRFESLQTLVAPASKEICVLYSSENASIAEKLGAPAHLRGLSKTLLVSHASIDNQLAYVAAVMQATPL